MRKANKTAGLRNMKSLGWLAERSNATVLKTADGATRPGVRIPHHPPLILNIPWQSCGMFFFAQFSAVFGYDITSVYNQLPPIRQKPHPLYTLPKIPMPVFLVFPKSYKMYLCVDNLFFCIILYVCTGVLICQNITMV